MRSATAADYERILVSSRRVFDQWKVVPAPKRGEAIRLVSEELRKHKSALGSLVTLEVGKIKAEGDGEVQEMIDIGDFAVGQSRMLYGQTMHSERPSIACMSSGIRSASSESSVHSTFRSRCGRGMRSSRRSAAM